MKAEIIAVGSELLAGTTVNTNGAYLARQLAMLGYDVHRQCVVPDIEHDITEALKIAVKRSHIIIFTGGLGPTKDDLAKETVAKALGIRLVKDEESERSMRDFFEQRGLEMTDNNLKQALVFEGCEVLRNANGTAPGVFLRNKNQAIILLPGPPFELEPMFENSARALLEQMADIRSASASLHVFGIGESSLEEKCRDILYGENPSSALYAKPWGVHINISARARTDEGAAKLLDDKISQYKDRLGAYIFSQNGEELPEVVVHMLEKAGHRLAIAESCTGGLLAERITSVSGASKVFELGEVTYSNKAKQTALGVDGSILRKYSAVSSATAAEMAKGALSRSRADLAVAITGIAGPSNEGYIDKPVGLVYIAVADKVKVIVKKFNFGSKRSRENVREMSAHNALDMIRRTIAGIKIEDAHEFSPKDIADLERKGRPRKKTSLAVEKGVVGLLCAAILGVGGFTGVRALRSRLDESVYSAMQTTYTAAQTTDALLDMREQNPDAFGWLSTSGGAVDCVVVNDRDDGFYKTHDFSGSSNNLGCPYVILPEDGSLPTNLLVYGTSADTKQVFGPLRGLIADGGAASAASDYLFNLTTDSGVISYKLAAVFIANDSEEAGALDDFYKTAYFADNEQFTNFVIEMKLRSVLSINTSIISSDSFLTLVSDLDDWSGEKLIVVARRLREGEAATMSAQMFSKNMAALYPDKYYELKGGSASINSVIERDRWRNWLLANEKNAGGDEQLGAANGGLITSGGAVAASPALSADGQVVITVLINGNETTDTPLNIVSRMTAFELDDSYSDEAIKALALASNSWLRYSFDIGALPSVSGSAPSERITSLASQVINEGIYYGDAFAFTPFFAISAGRTNSSAEIFGEAFPYLVSQESRYDYQVKGFSSSVVFARDVLKSRLESFYTITLSDNYENWITVNTRTTGGYADSVTIDGQVTTTGSELAERCLGLASSCFEVSWSDAKATFSVEGAGHGVGMSVSGANEYAVAMGWDYKAILEHYYNGTTVNGMRWTASAAS